MGASGDVDEIILDLGIEVEAVREIEQLGVDLLEIPRVVEVHQARFNPRFGGHPGDIAGNEVRQSLVLATMQKDQPVHSQIGLHA